MHFKKCFISLLICIQLGVVLLTPNQFSYLTLGLKDFLIPYTNLVGINSLWQFFSPDPSPALFYEYIVTDESGRREKYFFPPLSGPKLFRESYSRTIALMRVSLQYNDLLKIVIVPLLCRTHPEAISLDIAAMTIKAPSLQEVGDGRALNDLETREYKNMGDFGCFKSDLSLPTKVQDKK